MRLLRNLILLAIWLPFLVGFRLFPLKWRISRDDPTLWVKICDKDAIIEDNDLNNDDPLAGQGSFTTEEAVASVIEDYNDVQTSYFRLALYPDDENDPQSLPEDSEFTIEKASKRTIEVCFSEKYRGVGGGEASAKSEDFWFESCKITLTKKALKRAKELIGTLTHEFGHCVGLEHSHETRESIMTYFNGGRYQRLQMDDKMGISYLYPESDDYADEAFTYGASCSRRH